MSQIKPFPFARIPAYFRLARSQGNGCWTSFLSLLVEKEVCFHASALQRLAEETKSAFFFSIWSQAFRNAGRIAAKSCFTLKCRRRSHSVTDLVPPPIIHNTHFKGVWSLSKQASRENKLEFVGKDQEEPFFPPPPISSEECGGKTFQQMCHLSFPLWGRKVKADPLPGREGEGARRVTFHLSAYQDFLGETQKSLATESQY